MQLPEVASDWERCATAEDLAGIARVADELGYDHLTCAEHDPLACLLAVSGAREGILVVPR